MNTSVVLFKDEEGNVDFGLSIPDHGIVVCLCYGSLFDFDDVEILYDFNNVHYLEQAVESCGFYDKLPDNLKDLYISAK